MVGVAIDALDGGHLRRRRLPVAALDAVNKQYLDVVHARHSVERELVRATWVGWSAAARRTDEDLEVPRRPLQNDDALTVKKNDGIAYKFYQAALAGRD
jgi:hypothetical protein